MHVITKAHADTHVRLNLFLHRTADRIDRLRRLHALEHELRGSPVCSCAKCNMFQLYTGTQQLRLL